MGGFLVCGRCGYRMSVHFDGPDKRLIYLCVRRQVDYGGPLCQGLAGLGWLFCMKLNAGFGRLITTNIT